VLFPDAGGFRPTQPMIAPGLAALRNPRPLARLVEAAREAGVGAAPSRNAGSYLCNYIYWRALESARVPGGPRLVAFVHVPPVPHKARPTSAKRRRVYRMSDLVRASEAILIAMAALARTRRPATLTPRKPS
jgi:pyroglutamyl-peptidase